MILDLLADDYQDTSQLTKLFSKVNLVNVDPKRPREAQIADIEKTLGEPTIQSMLIYPKKYHTLGTVLSRNYLNAAKIDDGPLSLADVTLSPDHLSNLPNKEERNRVLFLAPHCDEPYLAAILLHKLMGDAAFLYSFTSPKGENNRIRQAYQILGLKKDDYSLDSLPENSLFTKKETIKAIIRSLLHDFKPTAVISACPKDAHSDHMAIAQAAREVVLNESTADLLYGYAIMSRNRSPVVFPLFPKSVRRTILRAYGKQGFNKLFTKYLPFLKYYMQTYSEPLFRMIGEKKLSAVYSLPLEAERISKYRIPNTL